MLSADAPDLAQYIDLDAHGSRAARSPQDVDQHERRLHLLHQRDHLVMVAGLANQRYVWGRLYGGLYALENDRHGVHEQQSDRFLRPQAVVGGGILQIA